MVAVLIASCSSFDQDYLTNEAFSFKLKEMAHGKKTKEKNGLFVVYGVAKNDLIIEKAFPGNTIKSEEYIPVFFNGRELGVNTWGGSISKSWKNMGGYMQMSIYYQKEKILLFGYFTGIGG